MDCVQNRGDEIHPSGAMCGVRSPGPTQCPWRRFSVRSLTYVDLFRSPGFPKCQGEAEEEVCVRPELAAPFHFRNALHPSTVGCVDCPSRASAHLTWRGAIAIAELETTVSNLVGLVEPGVYMPRLMLQD